MPAKVSVIIPVYNCRDYLRKCLQSVCGQSYQDLEIIIVDDGCDDGSSDIIDEFESEDKRVVAIREKNSGVSIARNAAIQRATGKYLVFVDSDDFIGEQYIEKLVSEAEENGSDMCFTGYSIFDNGRVTSRVVPDTYKSESDETWAYRISMTACRLYLRSYWEQNRFCFVNEPGARGEDIPVALYANATARNISFVQASDYYIVRRKGSATNSGQKVLFDFPYKAFQECYERAINNGKLINSREDFLIGVIKSLAQFEYVIFRRADKCTKDYFSKYVRDLIAGSRSEIKEVWKNKRRTINLPFTHKAAISLFIRKYC